ncbi:NAD-dependent succinate-semialdehyde dehydrogenase [Siminovitchia sp. 179-K 8D1 HS]|uniref:NAD-dependent succinate-semialdehyde dehydrogenase n=1 Tax=Siminovitchia sp. 179-K 8D1 HS TaxID=3142385 RepID=UPI0039A1AABF
MLKEIQSKLFETRILIDGEWRDSDSGETFSIKNPSTGETIACVPKGGQAETREAIKAAQRAFHGWSKLTANERAEFLMELKRLMNENKHDLALLMSSEMGKPILEAENEVVYAAEFLSWYGEEGKRIYGETIPASSKEKRLFVSKQPVGVTAAITPWNFPIAMVTRKIGPALAAGCTSVIKPSSESPLTALAFGKLVELSGIPKGVINIVTGSSAEISEEIFSHPAVRKISFTGSTKVGKLLVTKSASQLKKLSLELGGHAPFIVFDDADLDKAAEGAVASKFRNAGQTCICANRIYVHENVKDQFIDIFAQKVRKLSVGKSVDKTTQVGPLINSAGIDKVKEHVEDALAKGASVACGGKQLNSLGELFYEPTVLKDVTNDMLIMSEETFGPVAPIISFSGEEEVIQSANDTDYGLAAYLYTSNVNRAVRLSEELQFGVIGLNDAVPAVPQAPFGGLKQSGFGREGGRSGLNEYLEEKFISLGLQ